MSAADRPTPDELAELRERMELAGASDVRIEQVLRVAALDHDVYTEFREWYERPAAQAEARGVARDWDYPYERYDGEVRLGTNPDGVPVGLTREQLNEHMLIVGRTRAGKTTLFYNLLDECLGQDLPVMIFDFKNDYRHLVRHRDVLVVNWRDLKFNPLQPPPGVSLSKWGEEFADTWTHAVSLLFASRNHLVPELKELYRLYEPVIEEQGVYPSLIELRDLVAAADIPYASPRFNYQERIVSRLNGMLAFSREIFDCGRGIPIEELADRNVVIELQEPNQDVQTFIVEALLMWLFYYRDAQGDREGLRHVVMFDEAKQVFDRKREQNPQVPNPPITQLMGQVREFGEALVVADHEPSKLADSLKANTNAKLWLSLASGKDTEEMARTFGLDQEETDYTRTLEKGEAVLRLADREPVPVALPNYQLAKSMTDAEIREQMQPVLDDLSWRKRVRPDEFLLEIGADPVTDATDTEATEDDGGEDERGVGEVAEALLVSVNEEPFLSLSDRYDAIGVVPREGGAAKEELRTLGLVRVVEVSTGKPGRNPKLLELTSEGREVLESRGYEVAETGRRGITHRYWQHQIAAFYEDQGFAVEQEYVVDQKRIDVYAERDNEVVAVEVAMSPEHELANIEKCLAYEVDRVEVAYLEDSVRGRIETAVRDAFDEVPDTVVFRPVSHYA